jgi:adenosylcobinamide kinase/adenosylcobinamide-phosphate guanylyltransferase
MLTLILGGARSGKSVYAQSLCAGRSVVFVATARDEGDAEWHDRIARHRHERPPEWRTIEEPLDLAVAVQRTASGGTALVDCLGVWLSNLLYEDRERPWPEAEERILVQVQRFLAAAAGRDVVVVSNEVGAGTVPEHPVARRFRDVLGRTNQMVAQAADRVVLLTAGLPLVLKGERAR